MNLSALIHSIRFRFVQPTLPLPQWCRRFLCNHSQVRSWINTCNVCIPPEIQKEYHQMQSLCHVRRMSTDLIGLVLQTAVANMDPGQMYLNIGVWSGYSLFAGMLNHPERQCIGVDNFSQFGSPRASFLSEFSRQASSCHQFYDMDYEEFFAQKMFNQKIGVYFYDGEHSYENQYKGMMLATPYLESGSVIIVDDTNWEGPRRAAKAFLATFPNEYKVLSDIRTVQDMHPTWWNGLMIMQKI